MQNFPPGKQREKDKECAIDNDRNKPCAVEHNDAPTQPDGGECCQRPTHDRQAPRPVRNGGQQKTCNDGSHVSIKHFMAVPPQSIALSSYWESVCKGEEPQRHGESRVASAEKEERPVTIGEESRTAIGAPVLAVRAARDRH